MTLREKKGITLVELIVSVALTAVIITAACGALYAAAHSFRSGSASAFNQQRAALAESYLQRYAATATAVSSESESDKNGVFFSVRNNAVQITRQTVSDSGKTQANEASIDGISGIEVSVSAGVLHYTIVSQDGSYRLTGGIALNNDASDSLAPFTVRGDSVLFLKL